MKYISTRGGVKPLSFKDVVLKGLAGDGGLFIPDTWPTQPISWFKELEGKSYVDVAFATFKLFVGDDIEDKTLHNLLEEAYGTFGHEDVVPLKKLKDNLYILELFHGPTLAFKDVALQILARLMEHFLNENREKVTVFGATSGDTGAAAVSALQNRAGIEAFIFHPKGRISEVQRRQMTTCLAPNIHNIAIEGTFDNCQKLLKRFLSDESLKTAFNPTTINSINWARVLAQVVYYIYSGLKLNTFHNPVNFIVPSGNFGNAFAGLVAQKIGLKVGRFIIATNENDILARAFNEGEYIPSPVKMTPSPAMDIQVSSNFERYLFDCFGRDDDKMADVIFALNNGKGLTLGGSPFKASSELILAEGVSNEETFKTIEYIWHEYGEVVDPHTAVGLSAYRKHEDLSGTNVAFATAHPSKFSPIVVEAIGFEPEVPGCLSGILDKEEQYETVPNDYSKLIEYVLKVKSG